LFDPNQHTDRCEKYMERYLEAPVKILRTSQLTQSTRTAPWRLDVDVNGQEQTFVLQLGVRGLEYEYQVLKALEPLAFPTPRAYGLDVIGCKRRSTGHSLFF
jgi:hypothetical protein